MEPSRTVSLIALKCLKYVFLNTWERLHARYTPTWSARKRASDGTVKSRATPCVKMSSYFLKTVLLWELEDGAVDMCCPVQLFWCLLQRLEHCLENGQLPNYFNPNCNLIASMSTLTIKLASAAVQFIKKNPMKAILMEPSTDRHNRDQRPLWVSLRVSIQMELGRLHTVSKTFNSGCKKELFSRWRQTDRWVCNSCHCHHIESDNIPNLIELMCLMDVNRQRCYRNMCGRGESYLLITRPGSPRSLKSMLIDLVSSNALS